MTHVEGRAIASLENLDGAGRKIRVLRSVHFLDDGGALTSFVPLSRTFDLRIGLRVETALIDPVITVRVDNMYGMLLMFLTSPKEDTERFSVTGDHEITCRIKEFPLVPGMYSVSVSISSHDTQIDVVKDALHFTVADNNMYDEERVSRGGLCIARSEWDIGPSTTDCACVVQ